MNTTIPAHQEAITADAAQMAAVNDLTWPHEAASAERDPWTLTLDSGLKVIIWLPLSAAAEMELAGYMIRAASQQDLAENLARAHSMTEGWTVIECTRCTRADRCGNHTQHGEGCHCLYRDAFYRAYSPHGGTEILCRNHKHLAFSAAALVELCIE